MAHAFAAHFLFSYFNTTTVTYDTLVTDTLVLTAGTFIIFNGSEDPFAEQTITFRFVRTVVDRFRLQYFTITSFEDGVGGCQTDRDLGESGFRTIFFFDSHVILAFSC